MNLTLKINGTEHEIDVPPSTTLLATLRGLGFYGIKFGDEDGLSGSDTVLLNGKPVNAGSLLAAQVENQAVVTIEALGEHPEQGWRKTDGLHPLQSRGGNSPQIAIIWHLPSTQNRYGHHGAFV